MRGSIEIVRLLVKLSLVTGAIVASPPIPTDKVREFGGNRFLGAGQAEIMYQTVVIDGVKCVTGVVPVRDWGRLVVPAVLHSDLVAALNPLQFAGADLYGWIQRMGEGRSDIERMRSNGQYGIEIQYAKMIWDDEDGTEVEL